MKSLHLKLRIEIYENNLHINVFVTSSGDLCDSDAALRYGPQDIHILITWCDNYDLIN